MRANNGRMTHLRKGVAALALSVMFTTVACSDDTAQSTDCTSGGTTTSSTSGSGGSTPVYMGEDIAVGDEHACTIASGSVWCWGRNDRGQLGDNTTTDSPAPVKVELPQSFTPQPARVVVGDDHSCALYADDPDGRDGLVFCWGQWLPGVSSGEVSLVADVQSGGAALGSLTAGARHTCVARSGAAKCWGANDEGQLGGDPLGNTSTPLGGGVLRVWASAFRTCAAQANEAIWCWGNGVMAPEQVL